MAEQAIKCVEDDLIRMMLFEDLLKLFDKDSGKESENRLGELPKKELKIEESKSGSPNEDIGIIAK
jgi:hypothetical protein